MASASAGRLRRKAIHFFILCALFYFLLSVLQNTVFLSFLEKSLIQLVHAKISALGTYVPPRILSNSDLEKMVETSDEWITSRTGIRERHIVDKGAATSDLAVAAAQKALAERGLTPIDVEAFVVGSVTMVMLFISSACVV